MLSYEIAGSILTIRAWGDPTPEERTAVVRAVRVDSRVPNGALLLLDATEASVAMTYEAAEARLRALIDGLGPKVDHVCALVVEIDRVLESRFVQMAGNDVGIRVGIFTDEPSARRWLSAYLHAADTPRTA